MDYGKLDAGLWDALEEGEAGEGSSLAVFVRTSAPPGEAEMAFLRRLGVRGVAADRQVFTADLSPRAIRELSEQPWVQNLTLSRKLRLLRRR